MDFAVAGSFEAVANALPDPLLLVRAQDGVILDANDAAARGFGMPRGALRGVALADRVEEAPAQIAAYLSLCAGTVTPLPGALTPRGSLESWAANGSAVRGAAPGSVALHLTPQSHARLKFRLLNDKIDELTAEVERRRSAEAKLLKYTERLAAIVAAVQVLAALDTTRDGVLGEIVRLTQELAEAGGAFYARLRGDLLSVEAATGSAAPLVGRTIERAGSAAGAALATHRVVISPEMMSDPALDDAIRHDPAVQSAAICPVFDEDRPLGVLVVLSPLPARFAQIDTETLAMFAQSVAATLRRGTIEAQLRQSQRLEVVGQMTGGIAHDFNNLLTVILGNAELMLETGFADAEELVAMIRDAAGKGAELTARLLAFSRRQALDPKVIDVNRQVARLDGLLRRVLGEQIDIEVVRGGGLWEALVDPAQLDSALLNLCINARDAMQGGGRLTIETANAHLDQAYANWHEEVQPGQYVMIAVSDTGTGMSREVVARAFEPFFTTKPAGKGSGLGLSMVFGFVKQSNGHVKIYSEPGQGTVVKLYLPRAQAPAETGAAADPPRAAEPRGTATILAVEDDDLVRAYVVKQLRALGYTVIGVRNGAAALDHLRAAPAIDLLFTDVVLPGGLGGRELATQAQALRPGLPVLFTSGYTENAIVHHGRLDPGVFLLNKPYRRQELAEKIEIVLQAARR